LLSALACPVDRAPLNLVGSELECPSGHRYAVIDGIPVLLAADRPANHHYLQESLEAVERWRRNEALGWEADAASADGEVDGWVQQEIVHTCGGLYTSLLGSLSRYPIPAWPLAPGRGESLLDLGCNWGRWAVAAARAGYRVTGIDPSLRSLQAARRVLDAFGLEADLVVADARCLPFAPNAFAVGFSYSVLQHFSREDLLVSLDELARVVSHHSYVQMANRWGLRQRYAEWQQQRRGPGLFAVRRYAPSQLKELFEAHLGPSEFFADGYFTLNPQLADRDLLPLRHRAVVTFSELLRRASGTLPGVRWLADSLWISSRLRSGGRD